LEQNKKHFQKAAETPFGGEVREGILADLVGYSGLTKAAKAIVDGNFLDQYGASMEMLPETTHLIMELAMPDEIWHLRKINHEVDRRLLSWLSTLEGIYLHLSLWQASWSL
jgi:hypothetical protein